jgi:hypothetical protein
MQQVPGNGFAFVIEQITGLFAQKPDYGILPLFYIRLRHFLLRSLIRDM